MHQSEALIHQYYENFNQQDWDNFLSLLHEDVIHEINQGKKEIGKENFQLFMQKMNRSYKEKISDLVIMTNKIGDRVAAEFIVEGTYLQTDSGLPKAHNQTYKLSCGAFFEIKDNKIYRVTNYYNLNEWLNQVASDG